MGHGDFKGYLSEAKKAVAAASVEYEESIKKGDLMKLRDACEKAWLATLKATDALLEAHGLGAGETYKDRRNKLWKLKETERAVEDLGIYDRFNARMMILHLQGFYDGEVSYEQFKDEIEKVEKYIDEIEAIAKKGSQQR
ncbi:MAG: PaREP1 family protein [Candidatus Bathyarchaeia archaeon]